MSDPYEQFQADLLRPWMIRARSVIDRRLRDARNAADNALLVDSNDRLTELADALTTILQGARREFYTRSFPAQWAVLDPEIVDPAKGPTDEGREAAATADILDRDLAKDLKHAVETARRELTLVVAGTVNMPLSRPTALRDWEMRHSSVITLAATMALGNSQNALYHAIGKLLIKKELQ